MSLATQMGHQTAGGAGADAQPFAECLGGDRTLKLLPMQDILGTGSMQQVLPACLAGGLA
ncbi:hypothetical protein ACG83_30115 [Frankia sp. R43]|nr:hypothetical protein ACG83_30115 [Frankia sp. R43]